MVDLVCIVSLATNLIRQIVMFSTKVIYRAPEGIYIAATLTPTRAVVALMNVNVGIHPSEA